MLVIFYVAFRFGVIWDSQANPIPNATVHLQGDMTLKGSLSYTWLGDRSIEDDKGKVFVFRDGTVDYIAYKGEPGYDLLPHWRALLPIAITLFIWIFLVLPNDIADLRRPSRGSN